ncbi:hypothetical protein BDK51DRAFT_42143 [Blyttiomyces helicus]|uniref:Uncharacterized protein n=1 Tax=Blyttiomyces helicus TaxID=388810 RepID=A0A4P9WAF3_9FUNG|nr:hypothetical protein BDK51DRAFT_42143 [Blyttiomyces helicus]|eukprot:RKO89571.1 hypothetical protein BDK51DRAFT_42143 [Blyttiomyces helicus]
MSNASADSNCSSRRSFGVALPAARVAAFPAPLDMAPTSTIPNLPSRAISSRASMQGLLPLVLLLLSAVAVEAQAPGFNLTGLTLISCPSTNEEDALFLYDGGGQPTGVWRYHIPTSKWTQLATTQPSYDTNLAESLSDGYVTAALCLNNTIYGTLPDGSFTQFFLNTQRERTPRRVGHRPARAAALDPLTVGTLRPRRLALLHSPDTTTIYHPDSNTWGNDPEYDPKVRSAAAASTGDAGYVFGGFTGAVFLEHLRSLAWPSTQWQEIATAATSSKSSLARQVTPDMDGTERHDRAWSHRTHKPEHEHAPMRHRPVGSLRIQRSGQIADRATLPAEPHVLELDLHAQHQRVGIFFNPNEYILLLDSFGQCRSCSRHRLGGALPLHRLCSRPRTSTSKFLAWCGSRRSDAAAFIGRWITPAYGDLASGELRPASPVATLRLTSFVGTLRPARSARVRWATSSITSQRDASPTVDSLNESSAMAPRTRIPIYHGIVEFEPTGSPFSLLVLLLLAAVALDAQATGRNLTGLTLIACPATNGEQDALFLYGGGQTTGAFNAAQLRTRGNDCSRACGAKTTRPQTGPNSPSANLSTTRPGQMRYRAVTHLPSSALTTPSTAPSPTAICTLFVLDAQNASAPGVGHRASRAAVLDPLAVGALRPRRLPVYRPASGHCSEGPQYSHFLNNGAGPVKGASDTSMEASLNAAVPESEPSQETASVSGVLLTPLSSSPQFCRNDTLILLGGNVAWKTNSGLQRGLFGVYTFDTHYRNSTCDEVPVTIASGSLAPANLCTVTCAVVGSMLYVYSELDRTPPGQLHKLNLTSWSWISALTTSLPIPALASPTAEVSSTRISAGAIAGGTIDGVIFIMAFVVAVLRYRRRASPALPTTTPLAPRSSEPPASSLARVYPSSDIVAFADSTYLPAPPGDSPTVLVAPSVPPSVDPAIELSTLASSCASSTPSAANDVPAADKRDHQPTHAAFPRICHPPGAIGQRSPSHLLATWGCQ